MKVYTSIEQINQDLKRLKLEREIAWEEMKGLQHEVKEDLSAYNWIGTAFSAVKKYGIIYMIRKMFR